MITVFAVLSTLIMIAAPVLLFFSLPGTWIILLIAGLWSFFSATSPFTLQYFLLWGGLAALGELAEFFAGYFGTKKYGGSSSGSIGGMVGAIVGAIACAPLFFGIGALLGALGGGFVGCFVIERSKGSSTKLAAKAAWGTTLGRFGGFVIKITIAIVMLWHTIPLLWQ